MPTPTYNIQGANNVNFGTDNVASSLGVVVSASDKRGGRKRELKDTAGQTYAVVYFDRNNQCEFKAIFDADAQIPDTGSVCPVADMTDCLVDEAQQDWVNDQEQMLTIRATYYPGVALT